MKRSNAIVLNTGTRAVGGLGSLFFNASKLQHVNHGRFFRANTNYSHCFWEAWVKPSASLVNPGYVVSDNQGGNHNILWGVQKASSTHCSVTGNFYDGTTLTTFSPSELIPFGHDVHLAVGWDGSHIMCWINGILSHTQAYAPSQRMQPGGNDATLYIGGSDHNNFWGNIYQVRGYEGFGRCAETSDFAPELFFRPIQFPAQTNKDIPQFCVSYMTKQGVYVDNGKFWGTSHPGVPEAVQSTGYNTGSFIGTALSLPAWESGEINAASHVSTAPSTPTGAIIWDSFSRINQNYVNPTNFTTGAFVLGAVEIGGVSWTNLNGSAATSGAGINNGRAFIANQSAGKVVETSTQNVDVRVDRLPTATHYTGLYVRYKDDNDNYRIIATDTSVSVFKKEGGVETSVSYTPVAGWTTLRATAVGTTMTVYVGTATEGTFTLQGSFTCTNVAGATRAGIERPNGVKTPVYYDNFLVKAG